jgi:hypothetical protein
VRERFDESDVKGSDFLYTAMNTRFQKWPVLAAGLILTLGIFPVCEVRHPAEPDEVAPVLSDLSLPAGIYLLSDLLYPVLVRAVDPQGADDIATVTLEVVNASGSVVWQDTLQDNGKDRDTIAGDGVYAADLPTAFASGTAGQYPVFVSASDRSGNMSNTVRDTLHVFEGQMNRLPVLSDPVVPDSLTRNNKDSVLVSVSVSDPETSLDSVAVQVYTGTSPAQVAAARLMDDGTGGDSVAGDSVYSALMNLEGKLSMAPELSNLSAPDTVFRSLELPFAMTVNVFDPTGQQDIRRVYFNSYKPDGSPSSGNPFLMYDDGNVNGNGDQVAGDGIYSIIVQIRATNATGNYRFEFFAEDYSVSVNQVIFRFQAIDNGGAVSHPLTAVVPASLQSALTDPVIHIMTVVE